MPTRARLKKTKIEAEIRPNDRGGWEIGLPGEPLGIGNYPTWQDAYAITRYNYDESQIRVVHQRPTFTPPATINPSSDHDHPRNRRAARAAL